ncbi:hypothetical protein PCANC_24572 [Puccinia coronata f. sp. avenae]|uniref:Uncharacterized protein n=1 Tax=Puccinia coronata f. sp. avenae TaxID=200324 RepID=A0A2N5U2U5_9BASI|nr:hypothetical protein PCANC_24572 [Puccinia coronata f. sp. avenae]
MSDSKAVSDAAEESRPIRTEDGPAMAPANADESNTESDDSDTESDENNNDPTTAGANAKKTSLTLPPWITNLSDHDLMDLIRKQSRERYDSRTAPSTARDLFLSSSRLALDQASVDGCSIATSRSALDQAFVNGHSIATSCSALDQASVNGLPIATTCLELDQASVNHSPIATTALHRMGEDLRSLSLPIDKKTPHTTKRKVVDNKSHGTQSLLE